MVDDLLSVGRNSLLDTVDRWRHVLKIYRGSFFGKSIKKKGLGWFDEVKDLIITKFRCYTIKKQRNNNIFNQPKTKLWKTTTKNILKENSDY